jgi:hypothetical protein
MMAKIRQIANSIIDVLGIPAAIVLGPLLGLLIAVCYWFIFFRAITLMTWDKLRQ